MALMAPKKALFSGTTITERMHTRRKICQSFAAGLLLTFIHLQLVDSVVIGGVVVIAVHVVVVDLSIHVCMLFQLSAHNGEFVEDDQIQYASNRMTDLLCLLCSCSIFRTIHSVVCPSPSDVSQTNLKYFAKNKAPAVPFRNCEVEWLTHTQKRLKSKKKKQRRSCWRKHSNASDQLCHRRCWCWCRF